MDSIRYRLLLHAINKIQEAGLAPAKWPHALCAIARCVDSSRRSFYADDRQSETMPELRCHNINESGPINYAAYCHRVDGRLNGLNPLLEPLQPVGGTSLFSNAKMRRFDDFNDFLKPQDIRFVMTGFPLNSSLWTDIMSVFLGLLRKGVDKQSRELYAVLLQHVACALDTQRAIGRLQRRSNGLTAALDNVSQAVILLARNERLVYANAAAETILANSDGLAVQHGHLVTATVEAKSVLSELLMGFFSNTDRHSLSQRRLARIPRPSGSRAYILRASRIAHGDDIVALDELGDIPCVLVMLSDPEARNDIVDVSELRAVYGLTPAEASLTAALVEGDTLAQIADSQKVAVDTARKRLKSIFQKTETHRQSELVQRVLLDLGSI